MGMDCPCIILKTEEERVSKPVFLILYSSFPPMGELDSQSALSFRRDIHPHTGVGWLSWTEEAGSRDEQWHSPHATCFSGQEPGSFDLDRSGCCHKFKKLGFPSFELFPLYVTAFFPRGNLPNSPKITRPPTSALQPLLYICPFPLFSVDPTLILFVRRGSN